MDRVEATGVIPKDEPLILTLKMDDRSQERFDRLRELYFPPERNYLSAHLTMFHKLTGEQAAKVSPERARDLHERLLTTFLPFEVRGRGLSLWRYLAGPWEPVGTYPFGERPEEDGS